MREKVIEQIKKEKIVAIVRGVYGEDCLRLAEALYEGGIRLLEVTFEQGDVAAALRTQQMIRQLVAAMGEKMTIGAGTVTSVTMLQMAHEAGAHVIIAPNTDTTVIRATKECGLISIPGAMTPSEIFTAYECGADFVKVFPAGDLGTGYVKAVKGPFPHIPLLAVGGINEANMADFLKVGVAGFGVGGNLVNKTWIKEGAFDKITEMARNMCQICQSI